MIHTFGISSWVWWFLRILNFVIQCRIRFWLRHSVGFLQLFLNLIIWLISELDVLEIWWIGFGNEEIIFGILEFLNMEFSDWIFWAFSWIWAFMWALFTVQFFLQNPRTFVIFWNYFMISKLLKIWELFVVFAALPKFRASSKCFRFSLKSPNGRLKNQDFLIYYEISMILLNFN